jgi:hypothetical protein
LDPALRFALVKVSVSLCLGCPLRNIGLLGLVCLSGPVFFCRSSFQWRNIRLPRSGRDKRSHSALKAVGELAVTVPVAFPFVVAVASPLPSTSPSPSPLPYVSSRIRYAVVCTDVSPSLRRFAYPRVRVSDSSARLNSLDILTVWMLHNLMI